MTPDRKALEDAADSGEYSLELHSLGGKTRINSESLRLLIAAARAQLAVVGDGGLADELERLAIGYRMNMEPAYLEAFASVCEREISTILAALRANSGAVVAREPGKKWCDWCRIDSHNDADCWCTRPLGWKPLPTAPNITDALPKVIRVPDSGAVVEIPRDAEMWEHLRAADCWLGHWPEHDNKCPSCGIRSAPCLDGCYVHADQIRRHAFMEAINDAATKASRAESKPQDEVG